MFKRSFNRFPQLIYKLNYSSFSQEPILKAEKENFTAHIPVLCDEAVHYLQPGPNKTIIDMTFGSGGHSKNILENFENVQIYALDCDPIAYNYAKELSMKYPNQVVPLQGKFSDLPLLLKTINNKPTFVDGILFDFGCSSMQFDDAKRGFSISKDGPLDMRMNNTDPDQLTASQILSKIDEIDLVKILKIYGEEKQAKKIARCIINARSLFKKTTTTKQLAELINNCLDNDCYRVDKLQRPTHSATKTFQALRIFVNNELNEINYGMNLAYKLLKLNGRLVTITFHSLEDTIIKRHMQGYLSDEGNAELLSLKFASHEFIDEKEIIQNISKKLWRQLHKHVITPNEIEMKKNPRSRSAKLRALEKI